MMPTISEIIESGALRLEQAGVPDARRDAATLTALAIGRDRTYLYAYPEHQLRPEEAARAIEYFRRRADREPLQYIRGSQEFFGLDFEVTQDVLIPRPETEMLVERALEILKKIDSPRFIDIGTGSGCIPVAILANLPTAKGAAVDISPAALEVAKRNAERHGVAERLEFTESDLFENVRSDGFDVVVSNPPYVPAKDLSGLQPEVRDFEPRVALTDGGSGLDLVADIVKRAPDHLRPGGTLLIEFGFGQSEKLHEILTGGQWESVNFEPDLQGIPRILIAVSSNT